MLDKFLSDVESDELISLLETARRHANQKGWAAKRGYWLRSFAFAGLLHVRDWPCRLNCFKGWSDLASSSIFQIFDSLSRSLLPKLYSTILQLPDAAQEDDAKPPGLDT